MKIDESKFRFRIGDKVMFEGEEYTIIAYFFNHGFNKYDDYGYTIDKPVHNGSGKSYDENGEKLVFPEKSAYWAIEITVEPVEPVEPALTISDRLRNAPSGLKLFSPAYGEIEFCRVLSNYNIETKKDGFSVCVFRADGRINALEGSECLLFPSKENRDWTTVDYSKPKRQDLPTDTLCIVTDSVYRTDSCFFRYYAYKSTCYDGGYKSDDDARIISWKHIVSVDKFDFKTLTYKPEDDYGTESEYNR